jgi:PAS domain S-box-containing protein
MNHRYNFLFIDKNTGEMENTIKILHLDDNPKDSLLVQSLLKSPDTRFEYYFVDNEENFISILQNQKIDLILSDYYLPDYTGTEALLYAKENFPDIPFVFVSGTMGEDVAIESLLNGATDYVLKNNMERLVPAVQRAFKEAQVQKARLEAENELSESEKRYRLLFESSPMQMWVIEASTFNFLAVNESVILAYGYSREEFLKLRLPDLLPPEDKAGFLLFDAENQQKTRKVDKSRHLLKDGSIRFVEVISGRIVFEGKEARLVTIIDITEKIHAEEDLLLSEENFHISIAESPLGIRIVTVDGDTIYANKAFLDIYQFSSLEEFKKTPAKQRYSPECYIQHLERKAVRKKGLDVLEYELTIIRKDGAIRYLKVSRKEVLWNRVKHFQVIKIDITEQKNTELQLRKLSRAVEQSPNAIVITNLEGIIEYVNPKAVELTGFTVDELIGQTPRVFKSGETPKEEYSQLWETINSGNIWQGEFHNKKKSGELYWEAASISPILDKQGKITHFLAIKVDITATKKLIQDLNASKVKAEESDRLKTAFLNN